MKESNLDQEIREKLQGREIQPSASAWERLESQLDTVQEKKKKLVLPRLCEEKPSATASGPPSAREQE